jgi:hypothetical protein
MANDLIQAKGWREAFVQTLFAWLKVAGFYGPLLCAVLVAIQSISMPETTLADTSFYVWFLTSWVCAVGALVGGVPVAAVLFRYRLGLISYLAAAAIVVAVSATVIVATDQTQAAYGPGEDGIWLQNFLAKLSGPLRFLPLVLGYAALFWLVLNRESSSSTLPRESPNLGAKV